MSISEAYRLDGSFEFGVDGGEPALQAQLDQPIIQATAYSARALDDEGDEARTEEMVAGQQCNEGRLGALCENVNNNMFVTSNMRSVTVLRWRASRRRMRNGLTVGPSELLVFIMKVSTHHPDGALAGTRCGRDMDAAVKCVSARTTC